MRASFGVGIRRRKARPEYVAWRGTCIWSPNQGKRTRVSGPDSSNIVTPVEGAIVYAERVRKKIADIETTAGARLTVSAGVAAAQGYHEGASDVLAEADEALYAAKRDGRNRVVVHGESAQRTAA